MRLSKRKKRPFTQVDNKPLNEEMSFQAKGLLVYLLSKPDDWEIRTNHLIKQSGEKETKSGKVIPKNGRDAIRSMFAELIEYGYARIENNKDETGRFIGKIYRITEVAFCFDDELAPEDGISGDGKTDAGKTPHIVSTEKNQVLKETNTESLSPARKKIERTESGSVDVKSLKSRITEEAPPVPADPPEECTIDPELFIVSRIDSGPTSIKANEWMMKTGADYEAIQERMRAFANKFLNKEYPDKSDAEILPDLQGKNVNYFRRMFEASYIANWHKYESQPKNNEQSTRNNKSERVYRSWDEVKARLTA